MFIYDEKFVSKKEGYYYSCPWIEHGLVFFKYKLATCCNCAHEGASQALIRNNYVGQRISWDRIFAIKDMYRKFHKKGKIHANCINCPSLKEDRWNNDRYIDNLYISHWSECNSNCIYCYAAHNSQDFKGEARYNVLPLLKEMFFSGYLRAGGLISFGGGEPTVLNEFEDIITFLLDHYFYGIRVHTSGIKYSPALARAINEIRGYVVVSVDAGDRETYKKIKRIDKYNEVRETIRKYALHTIFLSRYFVSAKYIIIPGLNDTKEQIENWLQANYDSGLFTTVLDLEENWYLEHKDNMPKYILDLVKYAEKRSKDFNTNFELYERLQNVMADYNSKKSPLLRKILNK